MFEAKMSGDRRVITGEVRASFVHVDKPQPDKNGNNPKYRMQIIIPKGEKKTIGFINKAIDAAIAEWPTKIGGKTPVKGALKLPLRDGDVERDTEEKPEYADAYFMNCSSQSAPQIVGPDRKPLDPEAIYSGCYVRVSINFYPYSQGGSNGIAAGLGNIQFVRDGESLGGMHISAKEDFGAPDDEQDADDDFLS